MTTASSQTGAPAGTVLYEDTLAPGCHWSLRMNKGTSLRLIDVEGGANLGMMFLNPDNLLEKYNAPDTLKCQHTFKLTKGNCLYSDMGRIFCSITEDTVGWHETVCGNLTRKIVREKWTEQTYQQRTHHARRKAEHVVEGKHREYGIGRPQFHPRDRMISHRGVIFLAEHHAFGLSGST